MLPAVKRGLPEARLPFERPAVAVALVAASTSAGLVRRSSLPVIPREAVAVIASLVPALVALRGEELTSYHGAEHVSIGTYETGEVATKEHDRCGSHLVGPLLVASAVAGAAAELAPTRHRTAARARRRGRRSGRGCRGLRLDGSQCGSAPLARTRATRHGAAASRLDERAEPGAARGRERRARGLSGSGAGVAVSVAPSRAARRAARPGDLRSAGREDARRLLQRRVLQPRPLGAPARREAPEGRQPGLPAQALDARRDGRGDRDPQALLGRLGRR